MEQRRTLTRREAIAMLAALGASPIASAQDPVASDPRSFRVVLENERVRVLEYKSGPGLSVCGQGMHSHPDRVTIAMTDAKVKLTTPDGNSVVREIPAGHVFFAPAETHATENVGGFGTRIFIIELKDRAAKPPPG